MNNKTKVLEEIEKEMCQMIERSEDDDSATSFCIIYVVVLRVFCLDPYEFVDKLLSIPIPSF